MHYDKYLIILLFLWLNIVHLRARNTEEEAEDDGEEEENGQKGKETKSRVHKAINPRQPSKVTEQQIIQAILKGYDWRVRPNGLNLTNPNSGGPVKVSVNIYLRSISKIDDVNMEYSAQFTFREAWTDPRLDYRRLGADGSPLPSFIVLATGDSKQQIWMPDTFFQNEKEARKHDIDKPNVLIRIYPNGEILYSVRLSMVLSCPMGLQYYPLDEQKCLIDLTSYAYTTDDIDYFWKVDTPVQLKEGLGKSLPSFQLQEVTVGSCTSVTNTGVYSCLRTTLVLQREFSYYLLQLYIPSFMLVIVSWVSFWLDKDSVPARVTLGTYSCLRTSLILRREYSFYLIQLYIPSFMLVVVSWVNFWIDKDAVPARVSLGVTTLLTMTTQASGVNAKLPPVSYTKAIDVWIGVCLAFIFGALLEFALVNYAGRVEFLDKERKKQKVSLVKDSAMIGGAMPVPPTSGTASMPHNTVPVQQAQTTASTRPTVSSAAPFGSLIRSSVGGFPMEAVCPQCDAEREERTTGLMRPLISTSPLDFPITPVPQRGMYRPTKAKRSVSCFRMWLSKYKERSKRIDVISRLIFPIGFFFFNCIYWSAYMGKGGGVNESK